jgi:hypothetical protein
MAEILDNEIDEGNERVIKRAFKPKEDILEYLKTHNYDVAIKKHDEFIEYMLENPIEVYLLFKKNKCR